MNHQSQILEEIKTISKNIMEQDRGFHDYAHITSVYNNVLKILKYHKSDELILLSAALLHDIRRGEKDHGTLASEEVKKILKDVKGFPKDKIDGVSRLVMAHDKIPVFDDEKILFDADKMDALTDLGVLRSFMMYSKEGFTLKDSCEDYIKYINKVYNSLCLPISKKIIKTKYVNLKKMIIDVLYLYDSNYTPNSIADAYKL